MDDEELIRTILQGHGEVYGEIVERYQGKLFQTAYYYAQNVEDARDLTQEIFIKAYNNLSGFRFGSSFATWLYRIAVNRCIDWTRKKRPPRAEDTDLAKLVSEEAGPEEIFFRRETAAEIQAIVASLPEIYSTVLILYYFEDFSPTQIADILGTSKRTVETRLARGKKLLREKLHSIMNGGDGHDLSARPGRLAQLR